MSDNVPMVSPEENGIETVSNEKKVIAFDNAFNVDSMLGSAGTVKLTKKQEAVLFGPVDEDGVEIRPDGIVYLPWMEYVTRLRDAFGMEWAVVPQGMPKLSKRSDGQVRILWGFWLIIKGSLAGYAIGEHTYYPVSKSGKEFMGYSDACEAAKSNALMRLCKGIGISLELWRPSFIRSWKRRYAVQTPKGWQRRDEPLSDRTDDELRSTIKSKIAALSKLSGANQQEIGQMIDYLDKAAKADMEKMLERLEMRLENAQRQATADDASEHLEMPITEVEVSAEDVELF